ncbi:MAG: hypothetical protein AAB787_02905 [Patescibacteria group bacterium]
MSRSSHPVKSDQKYPWVATSATIISLLSVGFNIFWSIHSYNEQLPLQSANIVLNESGIELYNNVTPSDNPKNGPGDAIQLSLVNIGHSSGRNVRFRVYTTFFTSSTIAKMFDDRIIHDLQPNDKTKFGYFTIPYTAPGSIDLRPFIGKEQVVVLIHLEYENTLNQTIDNKFFLYHYTLGNTGISSVVYADYLKIKERLLNNDLIKEDPPLLNFLKDHN